MSSILFNTMARQLVLGLRRSELSSLATRLLGRFSESL